MPCMSAPDRWRTWRTWRTSDDSKCVETRGSWSKMGKFCLNPLDIVKFLFFSKTTEQKTCFFPFCRICSKKTNGRGFYPFLKTFEVPIRSPYSPYSYMALHQPPSMAPTFTAWTLSRLRLLSSNKIIILTINAAADSEVASIMCVSLMVNHHFCVESTKPTSVSSINRRFYVLFHP